MCTIRGRACLARQPASAARRSPSADTHRARHPHQRPPTHRVATAPAQRRNLRRRPFCRCALARALGPPHPRPTAVHVEPFPTSVLKAPVRVPATTTKIRTRGRSTRARARASPRPPRPLTPVLRALGDVSAARFSAIHFQGRAIRQVSCNTLLGGCRLSWPPPCCPDAATPFMVSLSAHSGAATPRPVHPASPVLLTKNGPLGAVLFCTVHQSHGTPRRFVV